MSETIASELVDVRDILRTVESIISTTLEAERDIRNVIVVTAAKLFEASIPLDVFKATILALIRFHGADSQDIVILLEAPFDLRNRVIKATSWSAETHVFRDAEPTAFLTFISSHSADC
jgi:hypothetical protein